MASSFIALRAVASTRCRVAGSSGTWRLIRSASAKSRSFSTYRMPRSTQAGFSATSQPRSFIPKPWAIRVKASPILPVPRTPTVRPRRSRPISPSRRKSKSRVRLEARTIRRLTAMARVQANSATE